MQVSREDEREQVVASEGSTQNTTENNTQAHLLTNENKVEELEKEQIAEEVAEPQTSAPVSSPFIKQPVRITSKLTPNAPEWTPSGSSEFLRQSPTNVQDPARKMSTEYDQLTTLMQNLNPSNGQNNNIQSVADAIGLQSSQELTEALASLEDQNFGKIDEAQILASKLIGQLQDNTISNPALLLQHLLGFAPEDYNDLVTALSESGCNYIQIVAAYLHNIQVQAQENNGNNPSVAMAARQTVINKYNYLISELNKFKSMKDPATNLLNVAKHVQGHYDPTMASLLQQRAAGGYGPSPSYSGLAMPRQHPSAPFGARDQYSALQQQFGASQMQQSPMLGSQSNNRLPYPSNSTSNLGLQLSDTLPLEADKQLELLQLLEAQHKYGMLGGDRGEMTKQELGDQSKHLASLGLQTMYGGAQRQAPTRNGTTSAATKSMWPYNSSMF